MHKITIVFESDRTIADATVLQAALIRFARVAYSGHTPDQPDTEALAKAILNAQAVITDTSVSKVKGAK